MAETFYFEIIASDKKFYSGACEHVIFPAAGALKRLPGGYDAVFCFKQQTTPAKDLVES